MIRVSEWCMTTPSERYWRGRRGLSGETKL
jgi:hypothetical protein